MLLAQRLAEQLDLTEPQAETLLALHQFSVMDYEIVDLLNLFPRSKMQERILGPLGKAGWLVFDKLRPKHTTVGANRKAWRVNPDRQALLNAEVEAAQAWVKARLIRVDQAVLELTDELTAPTPPCPDTRQSAA